MNNQNIDSGDNLLSDAELWKKAWDPLLGYLRKRTIVDTYHMEPDRMLRYTRKYGPMDWRHPASHAVYWAARGVERAGMVPVRAGAAGGLRKVAGVAGLAVADLAAASLLRFCWSILRSLPERCPRIVTTTIGIPVSPIFAFASCVQYRGKSVTAVVPRIPTASPR